MTTTLLRRSADDLPKSRRSITVAPTIAMAMTAPANIVERIVLVSEGDGLPLLSKGSLASTRPCAVVFPLSIFRDQEVAMTSLLAVILAATINAAPADVNTTFKPLKFREIGPAVMGGRIDDFAVVESNPDIIYVGSASGGVFKTTNGGITWEPIFDDQTTSTIGDVTVAPNDPSIVWVGTGEANNRQSSSWGNGVYKSTDGGKTWQHVGLAETRHIGRIAISPHDPNTVYVAAVGNLWGASKDRGVYKTTDGGKSWNNVLFVNEDTGITDITMDPESPGTLIAAAY